jgi:hypothetical protein
MLFLLRTDSTAFHFLYFCIFPSIALPPLSPLVFRVWEGPDWVCFGDAQSLPFVWRSSDPYGRAVASALHIVRPWWPTVCATSDNDEWRQEGDYSRSVR